MITQISNLEFSFLLVALFFGFHHDELSGSCCCFTKGAVRQHSKAETDHSRSSASRHPNTLPLQRSVSDLGHPQDGCTFEQMGVGLDRSIYPDGGRSGPGLLLA